jgi:hypothetical protein
VGDFGLVENLDNGEDDHHEWVSGVSAEPLNSETLFRHSLPGKPLNLSPSEENKVQDDSHLSEIIKDNAVYKIKPVPEEMDEADTFHDDVQKDVDAPSSREESKDPFEQEELNSTIIEQTIRDRPIAERISAELSQGSREEDEEDLNPDEVEEMDKETKKFESLVGQIDPEEEKEHDGGRTEDINVSSPLKRRKS